MPWPAAPAQTVGPTASVAGVIALPAYSAKSVNSLIALYVLNGGATGGTGASTVVDTQGNTWIKLGSAVRGSTALVEIWVTISPSTGSNTVTVTTSNSGTTAGAYIEEYSGNPFFKTAALFNDPSSPASANNVGTTTSTGPPSLNPVVGNCLVLTCFVCASTVTAISASGATLGATTTVGGTAHSVDSGRSGINPSFSWTTSRQWAQLTVAVVPGGTYANMMVANQ
jgi:hypothetical protein